MKFNALDFEIVYLENLCDKIFYGNTARHFLKKKEEHLKRENL